ncbi:MAG: mechanosensitive ion channel family protein [Cellvibrionaceae bacterium]|nr:mechanosensitive ion channel family protein [Cellvibrionaceae bacterium]
MKSKLLSDWLDYSYLWLLEAFLLVLITLLVALFARRFVNRLERQSRLTKNLWDDAFILALKQPLGWFIGVLGISFAADLVNYNTEASAQAFIGKFREISVVMVVAWFIVRLIKRLEMNVSNDQFQQKPMDETTARAMGKLLRAAISITAVLIIMQSMGYSISGILAFGGIGGLAVGFAAKDLLANFFGGLMIYLDRPFKVGDWVRSPDQEIEGTVEDIGWRLTRIRTFDKRPLYVPNATFTQIALENPSRMLNRRIKETIGIRYDDASKMDTIVNQVKAMLEKHPAIDPQQTLIVNFNAFAPSSLDFFIYTFTKTTDWIEFHQIKQDVLLKIIAIIEKNGAECAFPTSTVHLAGKLPFGSESSA